MAPDLRATGPRKDRPLLGVRAVIAESYERIHRSNLVGMGILPLQFPAGRNAESLNLTGEEVFEITGIRDVVGRFAAGSTVKIRATAKGKDPTGVRGAGAHRYSTGSAVLRQRRHPAVCIAAVAGDEDKAGGSVDFGCPPLESFVSGDLFDHQETSDRILFSHQLQSFTLTTGVSPNA